MARVIVPPHALVPVEEVKAFLRIEGSGEDALIAGLVRTATELCETFTQTASIEREVEETLPASGTWTRLSKAPVRAILTVWGIAENGQTNALPAEAYAIDIDAGGDGLVRAAPSGDHARIGVRYLAGQSSDWNGVPEPLRQGVVRMAADLYTHRDGENGAGPPAAVTALWLPYRRLRLR